MKKTYEAAIFNQHVRDLVAVGDQHEDFIDSWADAHYIEVKAESEEEARSILERRYPKAQGFVLTDIFAHKEFD